MIKGLLVYVFVSFGNDKPNCGDAFGELGQKLWDELGVN